MAQVSLPYTLTAGQPENVNQLVANLDALVAGVNTVNTAQIADANVTTAKIADAAVTADKLGATLADQLGITTTATARSVTVTQTAEINTNSTVATAFATSSELTTSANGVLRIVVFGEGKSAGTINGAVIGVQINDAGTYRAISSSNGIVSYDSTYAVSKDASTLSTSVSGTSYKKFALYTVFPFVSGGIESSAGKSQFRLTYYAAGPNAAYVKNVTATMTYIAA